MGRSLLSDSPVHVAQMRALGGVYLVARLVWRVQDGFTPMPGTRAGMAGQQGLTWVCQLAHLPQHGPLKVAGEPGVLEQCPKAQSARLLRR